MQKHFFFLFFFFFGFILELPPSMFSSAFREVNFKSSSVLLPAALRLPLHRDVVSIITAKPLFFLLCRILVHFLPPVISEITQTSGEPRREQSMASATQRLNPTVRDLLCQQNHCWGTPMWHRRAGEAQALQLEQRLVFRNWVPEENSPGCSSAGGTSLLIPVQGLK